MISLEEETFHIDTPDELGRYSLELYKSLLLLVEARQGKLIKFESAAQAKRVVNDLVLLADKDNNNVFEDKIRKTFHRRIYIRPKSEQ